ncbi:hypothetical protein [Streptomyces sp. NPDC003327]
MVESSCQLPVRRACRFEFGLPFLHLPGKFGVALFEVRDGGLQLGDIGAGSQPGFGPRLFAETSGQDLLQLRDPGGQAGRTRVGVGEVGSQ